MLLFSPNSHGTRSTARLLKAGVIVLLTGFLSQCTTPPKGDVVVSVKEQKLGVYSDGKLTRKYTISTSKFGLGDQKGSYRTPIGKHEIIAKIGKGLPTGAVLKSRQWNGEVLKPNAPGRDPIVSRILWLRGIEPTNRNAANRFIYIHGTTEENRLGKPASYGCVRMGMKDVVDLFNNVNVGAKVIITRGGLPRGEAERAAVSASDDGSPGLEAPNSATEPLEIAKLEPTEGEKKRAEENEAKSKTKENAGPEKPVIKSVPKSKAKTVTKPEPKVAGQTSAKSKSKA